MALNWKDNDLEEEQTVADTKKEDLLQPRGLDYGEEETVAFARKSDLVRTLNPRITTLPAGEDLPHTVISERLPLSPALPRDRFAAFLVDTLILAAANLILGRIINHFLLNSQIFGPTFTKYYFIFRTVSLFLFVMLYYVFFESSFGASPGKFLCRLRVVDLDGNTPSLSNVFLRNICRLFDYPLLFLVALLSIEGSRFHQRLGDRAAHTLVIKKTRKKIIPIDLRAAPLSSTFVRLCAFLIDSLFFGTFCWLYLSALNPENAFNPEKKATFQFFFWLFPFLFLSYFSVFEFLSSTTPGKFILGRKSILENGEPLDATAAILRNLFRPIDILLAYPLLALTRRKQRLGDLVAETLVIKRRHNPSGNIALICLVLLLLTLGFLAKQNPNRNWVKTEWQRLKTQAFPSLNTTLSPKNTTKNLLPNSSSTPNSTNNTKVTSQKNLSFNSKTIPASTSLNMKITEFYFSAGPDPMQIRMDGQFHRGDFIFMFFKLAGFEKVNSSARITEQIQIYNPQDQLILEKPNVLEFSQTLPEGSSSILFANQITLSNPPELGTYRVVILLKDENKKDQLVVEKSFVIQ